MQFTIDALAFYQALSRVKIRCQRYPYLLLRAREGQLTLLTVSTAAAAAAAATPRMQASFSLAPSALLEEGDCVVHYRQLKHSAKSLPGTLTIVQQEHAVVVTSEGPLTRQIPVAMQAMELFPQKLFEIPEEHACLTTKRTVRRQCEACQRWHNVEVEDTYQVMQVLRQQVSINRDLLASMCQQVRWVAKPEPEREHPELTGILVTLKNDVFSLIAADGHCLVIRTETLVGAGSWSQEAASDATSLQRALRLLPEGAELFLESVSTQQQLLQKDHEMGGQSSESLVVPHLVRLSTPAMQIMVNALRSEQVLPSNMNLDHIW